MGKYTTALWFTIDIKFEVLLDIVSKLFTPEYNQQIVHYNSTGPTDPWNHDYGVIFTFTLITWCLFPYNKNLKVYLLNSFGPVINLCKFKNYLFFLPPIFFSNEELFAHEKLYEVVLLHLGSLYNAMKVFQRKVRMFIIYKY